MRGFNLVLGGLWLTGSLAVGYWFGSVSAPRPVQITGASASVPAAAAPALPAGVPAPSATAVASFAAAAATQVRAAPAPIRAAAPVNSAAAGAAFQPVPQAAAVPALPGTGAAPRLAPSAFPNAGYAPPATATATATPFPQAGFDLAPPQATPKRSRSRRTAAAPTPAAAETVAAPPIPVNASSAGEANGANAATALPTVPAIDPGPMAARSGSVSKSGSVQCAGVTKSGQRCRRMTSDPSGYCYQHRPH